MNPKAFRPLHRAGVLACLLGTLAPATVHAEFDLFGFVAARGIGVESQPSWRSGGFGRLPFGADPDEDESTRFLALSHVGLDWRGRHLGVYLHAAAREEPSDHRGEEIGLVEGFVEATVGARKADTFAVRLGAFILPTSQENIEALWTSPYTLTLSAINTWVGEEVRPVGLDSSYTLRTASGTTLRIGGTLFGGNDSAGALLAWRGWALGGRLAVAGEVVPLPPIDSLTGGAFALQRDDGTRPFGTRDLDDRLGWSARLGLQLPDRLQVSFQYYDNRGDRDLHDGEYAWETSFEQLGATWLAGRGWTLAGEGMRGYSGMGDRGGVHAQIDFESLYLLASWQAGRWRTTVRWDTFENVDRDGTRAENSDESGDAWTAAVFFDPTPQWRLGLELLDVDGARPAAAQSGFDGDASGRMISFELRYLFGVD